MEVLVVGAGSIGRWFGRVLTSGDGSPPVETGTVDELRLDYFDPQLEVAKRAASETGGQALSTVSGEYDLVCIAVPIPAATNAIATHAGRATRAAIDVTGTMREPVDALSKHAPGVERCSFHPLFSPANEPGNVPVVVDRGGPVTKFVRETLQARGNNVFETTPSEHDEAMKTVQARAHAAILAYGLAAESVPERFQTTVSSELDALVEQVTGGDARVYSDIQEAFGGAADVVAAADTLASADGQQFEQLYDGLREGER
jgi:prephenate dehydrogenase